MSPFVHKKKYTSVFLAAAGFFVVVFSAAYLFPKATKSGAMQMATPLWRLSSWIRTHVDSFATVIRNKQTLAVENQNLKNTIQTLEAEVLASRVSAVENHDLKQALGRKQINKDFLLANILVKPNRSLYDTLVIDQGRQEGVVVGAHIYAVGVYPIGGVAEVFEHTALISLYSTPGRVTTVRLLNTNTDIDLLGRGGGSFEAKLPRDLTIEQGEPVVLPQFANAILALVDTVVSDERDPFKKVLFRSPVNIQELSFVFIAK